MSASRTIDVGPAPVLHLTRIDGDLVLSGHAQPLLSFVGDASRLEVTQDGATVHLACHDDCVLQVPVEATLHLGHVNGDARIHGLAGTLHVQEINGDLSLADVGATTIQTVSGDLSAQRVRGDLIVAAVRGDASVANIAGACRLADVSDDLSLGFVEGDVEVSAGDDLSLRLPLRPGTHYTARAGSDLVCRIPVAAGAQVDLQAGSELKVRRLPVPDSGELTRVFTLGDGAATLTLSAGDTLSLIGSENLWGQVGPFDVDVAMEVSMRAAEFAQQIATQVETQVASITRQLDEKLTQLSADEELATRIQDKVQAAMRTAEQKIAEVTRQAEQRARAAERRAAQSQSRGGQNWSWSGNPSAPKPPKPPAPVLSDEERMLVLRMVEEGKISVEQAEQLLQALRDKRG